VTIVVAIAAGIGTLMQSIIVPIIARVPDYLGTSAVAASWLFTGMLVAGAVSSVVFGRFADMYGKRRLMLIALAFLFGGSVLCAIAPGIELMIVGRVLQGFSVACVPIAIGILRDVVDGAALVRGIAFVSMTTSIGGGFGAAIAGVVAEYLPWRALFWGSAGIAILAIAAVLLIVPAGRGQPGTRFDPIGTIGLVVGLVTILLGISNGGVWGWASAPTFGCLVGGAVVLALWGWFESRRREPLIDVRLLASRPVLFTNLASLLYGFGTYAILVAMPQIMLLPRETGFGLGESVLMAGIVGAPSLVFAILAPFAASWLIRRIGARWVMALAAVVLALGYAYMFARHESNWDFVIANIVITIGLAWGFSATPALLLEFVPREQSAESNGVNTVIRTAGMALSTAVTATILASMPITEGFGAGVLPSHAGFLTVFAVAGAGCLLVIPLIALVGREHPERLKRS